MLQAGARIAHGQWPYRDFWTNYPPGQELLLTGLDKLFGVSLLSWRIVRVIVDTLTALLAYGLVRRSGAARPWALLAWLGSPRRWRGRPVRDPTFVQHLAVDDQDVQIVWSTIDLGHSLGRASSPKGSSTSAHWPCFATTTATAQGFYLGRPVAPDALLVQLRDPTPPSPTCDVSRARRLFEPRDVGNSGLGS